MKIKNYRSIICFVLVFLCFVFNFFAQEVKLINLKPSIEFYPSVSAMYGFLYYETEAGDKNKSTNKYYNNNYSIGIQINSDIKLAKDFIVQLYSGYNRWNQADLFPIGIMAKPKLNKRNNEFYLKLGGGYTFGKRYDDPNERWLASDMPRDYGNGNIHGQLGVEKNWHLNGKKSIAMGFMINLQLIKSYTTEFSYSHDSRLFPYFIPYKFAGLTLAYHFY